jgi:hypothetical protein
MPGWPGDDRRFRLHSLLCHETCPSFASCIRYDEGWPPTQPSRRMLPRRLAVIPRAEAVGVGDVDIDTAIDARADAGEGQQAAIGRIARLAHAGRRRATGDEAEGTVHHDDAVRALPADAADRQRLLSARSADMP